jgi:hypothetical protein
MAAGGFCSSVLLAGMQKPVASTGVDVSEPTHPRRSATPLVLRGLPHGSLPVGLALDQQRHEREERQTQRGGTCDGQIVPFPLTFDAQVRAGFLEGDAD